MQSTSIVVPKTHRKLIPEAIPELAKSIELLGLQHPPAVHREGDKLFLAAGLHRLEACRFLGHKQIRVRILEKSEGMAWSSSENIHRSELSRLDQADQLIRYERLLIKLRKGERNDHPRGGAQPHDKGNKKLAAATKLSRKRIRQFRVWASISEPAKKVLRANGLDDDLRVLNLVSAETGHGELAAARNCIKKTRDQKNNKLKVPAKRPAGEPFQFEELRRRWQKLKYLRPEFNRSDNITRRRFAAWIVKAGH